MAMRLTDLDSLPTDQCYLFEYGASTRLLYFHVDHWRETTMDHWTHDWRIDVDAVKEHCIGIELQLNYSVLPQRGFCAECDGPAILDYLCPSCRHEL